MTQTDRFISMASNISFCKMSPPQVAFVKQCKTCLSIHADAPHDNESQKQHGTLQKTM